MAMNCDLIARWYSLAEHLSFGSQLQRRRCRFLSELTGAGKVLLVGEGDGRFLAEFVKAHPEAQADCVDISQKMLRQSAKRTRDNCHVHFHHLDATCDPLPGDGYDATVTHFFLDCLSEADAHNVVKRLSAISTATARWIVSEFREPAAGWQRWRAKVWIRGLYAAFRVLSGLETQQLPDYREALRQAGFELEKESLASCGMLTSQLWRKKEAAS